MGGTAHERQGGWKPPCRSLGCVIARYRPRALMLFAYSESVHESLTPNGLTAPGGGTVKTL